MSDVQTKHPSPRGVRPWLLLLAVAVALADQTTKLWVVRTIPLRGTVEVLAGIFSLTHIRNPGGAFGLLRDHPNVLLTSAVCTSAAILVYLILRSQGWNTIGVGLALILGGAVGNLIDRFRLGYVVDFFHLRYWPQFNVADTAVTVGAVLIALWMVRRPKAHRAPTSSGAGVPIPKEIGTATVPVSEGAGVEAPASGSMDPETDGG